MRNKLEDYKIEFVSITGEIIPVRVRVTQYTKDNPHAHIVHYKTLNDVSCKCTVIGCTNIERLLEIVPLSKEQKKLRHFLLRYAFNDTVQGTKRQVDYLRETMDCDRLMFDTYTLQCSLLNDVGILYEDSIKYGSRCMYEPVNLSVLKRLITDVVGVQKTDTNSLT